MSILDQLEVAGGNDVETLVVPPEELSEESKVAVFLPASSPLGDWVRVTALPRLARELGTRSIVGIVHDGGTEYTARTESEEYVTFDATRNSGAFAVVKEIAAAVESAGLRRHNTPGAGGSVGFLRFRESINRPPCTRPRSLEGPFRFSKEVWKTTNRPRIASARIGQFVLPNSIGSKK